jgi:hypothetical protein
LLIEGSAPLKLKLPTEDLHLQPGVPVILPDPYAKRLLEKMPGKVRVISPGDLVSWSSPALGELEGEFIGIPDAGGVAVFHPIPDTVLTIPASWLTRSRPIHEGGRSDAQR